MGEHERLTLPPLLFGPIVHPVGHYYHVIRPKGVGGVTGIAEVPISPRLTAPMYTLSNGERIVVTSRRQVKQRPSEADGVLRVDPDGTSEWIWHKSQEAFAARIAEKSSAVVSEEISANWKGQFDYRAEISDANGEIIRKGLRPPQIGGLHAIGAHWSIYNQPATVVMPTGTGKTETMLATLAAFTPGRLLIVVPSQVLRNQTADKFATFGLLRVLGNLAVEAVNPIVGVMSKRPRDVSELDLLERCNVVVTTMSAINDGTAAPLGKEIAARVGTLIVDEAHHIGADGWAAFREHFVEKRVLQFTATPYRRDGKLVDGKVIYSYPLQRAQQDGYFKKITFEPVYEIDDEVADNTIATAGIAKLRADIAAGLNHRLMARCDNIDRASTVFDIYKKLALDLRPVLVHSEAAEADKNLAELRTGKSLIVVCVNMLGEGFDLPQLKIAAVHDTHKSLAVLLHFTGRFTRTAGKDIGDATVIANIADSAVSSALERLYSEDADWNQLLSELSSEAAKAHAELIEFLGASQRLDESADD